jgi:glutamine synthetase
MNPQLAAIAVTIEIMSTEEQNQNQVLELEVPETFANALQKLAEREATTESILIQRAIGLYVMAINAELDNYALSFRRYEETGDLTVKEIIRLRDEEPKSNLILP